MGCLPVSGVTGVIVFRIKSQNHLNPDPSTIFINVSLLTTGSLEQEAVNLYLPTFQLFFLYRIQVLTVVS